MKKPLLSCYHQEKQGPSSLSLPERGFTLIEMLVVMAILGLVLTGMTIKRNETLQRKKAERSAVAVKQMIELAKDYALTGESLGGAVPTYVSFEYDAGNNLFIRTNTGANMETGTVDAGVTLAGDNQIRFSVPYGEFDTTTACAPLCTVEVWGGAVGGDPSMKFTVEVSPNSVELK